MGKLLTLQLRHYSMWDGAGICFRCAPVSAFFYGFFGIAMAVLTPIKTLVVARFIDAVIESFQVGAPGREVYVSLGLIAAITAFYWLERTLHNFADLKLVLELREKYRTALIEKRTRLAYRHIEDTETWDLVQRVAENPEGGRLKASYYHLVDVISFIIKVAGLLWILTAAVWWGALAVVAISALTLITGIRGGKIHYQAEREVSRYDRRSTYVADVLVGRGSAVERTLFGYSPQIQAKWRKAFESAMGVRLKARIRWYLSAYLGNLITLGSWIFMMVILLPPVRAGVITIGLFIALTQAFTSLDIVWGFMETVHGLAADSEFFKDLTAFIGLEEQPGTVSEALVPAATGHRPGSRGSPEFESLGLRNVSFRYPGGPLILDGFTYTFERGVHYALVGANGTGKTTLTRLLTGLYPPSSGEILLNERDLNAYPYEELISFFSLVYQDFARYNLTLRDNVLLGGYLDVDTDSYSDAVLNEVIAKTGLAGAVARLHSGVDTPLGKLKEDGVDISGGEWQRVAMARALARPAPIRILDEPTASMDPVAESNLYDMFDRITTEATTLLISHRLGATKIADVILVIADGRIVESGSHKELMALSGLYREMFESQRSWYEVEG